MMVQKHFFSEKVVVETGKEIDTIAVVNMDDGIQKDGISTNYANQLIEEDSNYILTGLNDAREGVEKGLYAAYVIIPENFSTAIESINRTPEVAMLQYEVNTDLNAKSKEKTLDRIYTFEKDVNYKVGYIYLTSILSEFHDGQKEVANVLTNDEKNQKIITAVNVEDLTADIDISPYTSPENEVKDISMEDEKKSVKKDIEVLQMNIQKDLESSSSQYQNVISEINEYITQVEKMNVLVDDNNNEVYDISALENYLTINDAHSNDISNYVRSIMDKSIHKAMRKTEEEMIAHWDDTYVTNSSLLNLNDGETLLTLKEGKTLEDINYLIEIEDMNGIKEIFEDNARISTTITEELLSDISSFRPTDLEESLKQEILSTLIDEMFDDATIVNTEGLKKRIYRDEDSILNQSILNKIRDNQSAFQSDWMPLYKQKVMRTLSEYQSNNVQNDVLTNVDDFRLEISKILDKVDTNIMEYNRDYQEHISNLDVKTKEYVEQLITKVHEDKENTNTQVLNALSKAKDVILLSGEENAKVLKSFASKLPYSKQGENQNQEVKKHILEPTDKILIGEASTKSNVEETKSFIDNYGVSIVNGLLVVLLIGNIGYVLFIRRQRK